MISASFDVLLAIAAIVAILDYFGIKPKGLPSWRVMPLSRKWKLAMMLLLVAAALGMSGYSFYRAMRPKIIERVVEKPIPVPCPQLPSTKTPPIVSGKQSGKNDTQSGSIKQGSGSIAQVGGSGNTAIITTPPPREFSQTQHDAIVSVLSSSGVHTIAVRAPNTADGEAQQYDDKITSAIEDGGWNINPRPKFLIWQRHVIGVWILVEDTNNPAPCAISLQKALGKGGINAPFLPGGNFYNGNEPCELVVGSQQ